MKLYQIPLYKKIQENCKPVNEIGIETYATAYQKNKWSPNIQLDRQEKYLQGAINEFNEKYGYHGNNLIISVVTKDDKKVIEDVRLRLIYKYKDEFVEKLTGEAPTRYKYLYSPTIVSGSNMWDFEDGLNSRNSGSMSKTDALLYFVKELTTQELKQVEIAVVAFTKFKEMFPKFKQEHSHMNLPDWMK